MTIFTKEDVGKDVKCACMGNGVLIEILGKSRGRGGYLVLVQLENGAFVRYTQTGKIRKGYLLPSLSLGHFEEDHNE